ncbi:MAG: 2-succinyl-5-enolpyruvyl-6-hydroxy-3-cyclohexene-1-carboxylic-acid synthase [Bacteroidia bacterium]
MQQHVYSISGTFAQLGVKQVVICPGSRSAPLVAAFTRDSAFTCSTVVDERSAAFIALGMAQQLQEPVILICTSGTAVLNFYPAVAEAFYQHIPLIILSADRPPELLDQQDGQMIHQVKVFGKHVLLAENLPDYAIGKENFKLTATIARQAFQTAMGLPKGPVHINIPLHEPLYKISSKLPAIPSMKPEKRNQNKPIPDFTGLKNAWEQCGKRLILLGQGPVSDKLFTALYRIKKQQNAVIMCDPASNQFSFNTTSRFDTMLSQANFKTLEMLQPDCIVSAGGPLVSKTLKLWLKNHKPKFAFRIRTESARVDTYNHKPTYLDCEVHDVLNLLNNITCKKPATAFAYMQLWETAGLSAEMAMNQFLNRNEFSELHATRMVLNQIPDAVNLHIGNSSVIRYVSLLGELNPSWTVHSNRGTSGIDGCSSTAVGAAAVNNKMTVLLTGDLGFLYDKNAFWNNLVQNNLRIIVINNGGGGIFSLIDGPGQHPENLPFFTTPHHQNIRLTALDNNLEYYFCDSAESLKQQLNSFFQPGEKSAVLEIQSNMKHNASVFKRFKKITL